MRGSRQPNVTDAAEETRPHCLMNLQELNRKDAEIDAHALRAIKAAKREKQTREETHAAINEILIARDNARGELARDYLRV